MIGQQLGNYEILEQIGQGAMSYVYSARDVTSGETVAVKVLPEELADDEQFSIRFRRESQALQSLQHENILPVIASGDEDGILYIVMPLMENGTFDGLIRAANGQMPLANAIYHMKQIATALDFAHQRGILHRDLKPDNIMVDAGGNCYLMDFGLAKIAGESNITGQHIIGTPQYMSPEQCWGKEDIGPEADQYSLGILTYVMLTNRNPYDHKKPMVVIQKQLQEPMPQIRDLRPDSPPLAQQAIIKATAKQPEYRFPSCISYVESFEAAVYE